MPSLRERSAARTAGSAPREPSGAAGAGAAARPAGPRVSAVRSPAAFAVVSAASSRGTESRTTVAPVVSRTDPSAVMSAVRSTMTASRARRPPSWPATASTPL